MEPPIDYTTFAGPNIDQDIGWGDLVPQEAGALFDNRLPRNRAPQVTDSVPVLHLVIHSGDRRAHRLECATSSGTKFCEQKPTCFCESTWATKV
jgi:hypothetical protein